jgi:WD40 repeat protein
MHGLTAVSRIGFAALALCLALPFPGCAPTPGGGGVLAFNLPPTPVITSDVVRGVAPLTVRFNSDRSTDDGQIIQRLWDFGDGATSEEISPRHTFTTTGDFTVTLTLTDDDGAEASRSAIISVTQAPIAVIAVDPPSAESAPAIISFDGSASYDPDGEIIQYEWDFGDSSGESLESVTHVYAASGTYRAVLTVTDNKGVTGSAETLISVGIPTPTMEVRVPPAQRWPKVARSHVTARQTNGAVHTLEVVGADDGKGWGRTAVEDPLVFDTNTAKVQCQVIGLAVGGDADKISVFSLEGSSSFAATDKPVTVYTPTNIMGSVDSPLWIQAVYDVEPGTPRYVRAGIDGDEDQCEAQSVLYALSNGATIRTLTGHDDRVTDVAFAPDGQSAATAGEDGAIRTYDLATGDLLASFDAQSAVNAVAFSPNGNRLVWGEADGDVKLADLDPNGISVVRAFNGHTAAVNDVAFSPDGTQILTGSNDRRALLWNVADATVLRDFGHDLGVNAVAFSPADPTMVATGSEDETILIWNTTSGAELLTLAGHSEPVNDIAFSTDGLALISGSDDNTAIAWSPFLGLDVITYSGHTDDVVAVAISPDGSRVVTGSADGTARVWDSVTAETLQTVQPCESTISSVAFSPDGSSFLAGVAARNDIQLDTDPPNGNDLNITYPQALLLKNVADLGFANVPTGQYYLWAEVDTDRTEQPVRSYVDANVFVIDPFTTTVGADTPMLPLTNNQASVVVPLAAQRQIFDLGPLNRGDRLFVSLLSTPGFGEFYTPTDEFSVMILDADQKIFAWYQALRESTLDPNDVSVASLFPELRDFVLFSRDTKLVIGHNSLHYYVVVDGEVSVNVRVQRDSGLYEPRQQRVFVNFEGGLSIAAGNQPPRDIPALDAADFNNLFSPPQNWDDDDTLILKNVIMTTIENIYAGYDILFVSSDDGYTPSLPYHTVYVGGQTPDGLLGIPDYVDPRNETATGTAIVYATEIAELGIGGEFADTITSINELGLAMGRVAAHQIGHLLGLRHSDDATDIMQGDVDRETADPTVLRVLKAATVTASEQVGGLGPIGTQDAPLLLRETVGLGP